MKACKDQGVVREVGKAGRVPLLRWTDHRPSVEMADRVLADIEKKQNASSGKGVPGKKHLKQVQKAIRRDPNRTITEMSNEVINGFNTFTVLKRRNWIRNDGTKRKPHWVWLAGSVTDELAEQFYEWLKEYSKRGRRKMQREKEEEKKPTENSYHKEPPLSDPVPMDADNSKISYSYFYLLWGLIKIKIHHVYGRS